MSAPVIVNVALFLGIMEQRQKLVSELDTTAYVRGEI